MFKFWIALIFLTSTPIALAQVNVGDLNYSCYMGGGTYQLQSFQLVKMGRSASINGQALQLGKLGYYLDPYGPNLFTIHTMSDGSMLMYLVPADTRIDRVIATFICGGQRLAYPLIYDKQGYPIGVRSPWLTKKSK